MVLLQCPASKIPPPTLNPASPAYIRYVSSARSAGCPKEQIANFTRAGVVLQTRQLEASAAARLCDEDEGPTEIGYGGSRGGGKSHWLLSQIGADDCQRFPGLKCLILRKVGKSLKEGVSDLLRRIFRTVKYKFVPSQNTIFFPNGSMIILGHFQKESDIDTYLGLEYDVIGVEEATTLSSSKYQAIRTCCRTSKTGWRPRMYSTTNPGNIGHGWYKALFIEPQRRGEQAETHFIAATVDDNSFINKEYKKQLEKLKGWQLRAWRYGDWDIAAGQYFTNFRASVDNVPHHVIATKGFELAQGWRVWCALDYGFTHFTVVHLLAQDGDGNIYIVDEHAERGWLPERHAKAVKDMLGRNGLELSRLWKFVAGADVFSKRPDGATVADQYAKWGIRLEAANDDRISGASEILNRLGDVDATEKDANGEEFPTPIAPRLFILDRCARLVETIPALQHDPHRPEDVLKVDCDEDGIGGDDFYDSARYGVMAAVSKPVKPVYSPSMAAGNRMAA